MYPWYLNLWINCVTAVQDFLVNVADESTILSDYININLFSRIMQTLDSTCEIRI